MLNKRIWKLPHIGIMHQQIMHTAFPAASAVIAEQANSVLNLHFFPERLIKAPGLHA
jgi:hypothetical protein